MTDAPSMMNACDPNSNMALHGSFERMRRPEDPAR